MTDKIRDDWINEPGVKRIMSVLTGAGHQAWFVGGAVRDALLGRQVGDIDVATDALPDAVIALAAGAGIKAVPTGIDHGTVTLIAPRPIEVTTFRRDVDTDGRRATVEFGTNITEDAARRDLTMNAIYADANGNISDPLGGLPDVLAGRIRFIGDASTRIAEDYLRSLRFFRFYAWFGNPADGPDRDALAAIAANIPGLDTVSKERVGAEFAKLLRAPDPAPALAAMAQTGVLPAILPGADAKAVALLVHFEGAAGVPPSDVRRLAVLGLDDPQKALRLSRQTAKAVVTIRAAAINGAPAAHLGYRIGAAAAFDALLARAALMETPPAEDAMAQCQRGAQARFPVRAKDLAPLSGPELGQRLRALEAKWIASDFALTGSDLIS